MLQGGLGSSQIGCYELQFPDFCFGAHALGLMFLDIAVEYFLHPGFFKGDGQLVAFNRLNAAITEFHMEDALAAFIGAVRHG